MKKFHYFKKVFLISGFLLLLSGCQSFYQNAEEQDFVAGTPVLGSYLDFEDVQVPRGLKLDPKRSYVYQTESIKTGVLSFNTTRTVVEVLADFEDNMPRDNWVLVSNFKFHKNILLYHKTTKNCLIIVESRSNRARVKVEIWLSPVRTEQEQDSGVTRFLDKQKEKP